jgi:hypothetical protein
MPKATNRNKTRRNGRKDPSLQASFVMSTMPPRFKPLPCFSLVHLATPHLLNRIPPSACMLVPHPSIRSIETKKQTNPFLRGFPVFSRGKLLSSTTTPFLRPLLALNHPIDARLFHNSNRLTVGGGLVIQEPLGHTTVILSCFFHCVPCSTYPLGHSSRLYRIKTRACERPVGRVASPMSNFLSVLPVVLHLPYPSRRALHHPILPAAFFLAVPWNGPCK